MSNREYGLDEHAIRSLRNILQMFASPETAEEIRLGTKKSEGFDSLELLELLEDVYPTFRPPILGAEPPGFIRLPKHIGQQLVSFYDKVSQVINPSIGPNPIDSELMTSPAWSQVRREASHLDQLLSNVKPLKPGS